MRFENGGNATHGCDRPRLPVSSRSSAASSLWPPYFTGRASFQKTRQNRNVGTNAIPFGALFGAAVVRLSVIMMGKVSLISQGYRFHFSLPVFINF
jgi:hypothetical protein